MHSKEGWKRAMRLSRRIANAKRQRHAMVKRLFGMYRELLDVANPASPGSGVAGAAAQPGSSYPGALK